MPTLHVPCLSPNSGRTGGAEPDQLARSLRVSTLPSGLSTRKDIGQEALKKDSGSRGLVLGGDVPAAAVAEQGTQRLV